VGLRRDEWRWQSGLFHLSRCAPVGKIRRMKRFRLDMRALVAAAVAATLGLHADGSLAQASDVPGAGLRVSGFGSLGLMRADGPEGWRYRREIGQPGGRGSTRADTDSRLGLQLNYAPSARVEWVGQLLATRRSAYASPADIVEWAFVAYRPNADLTLRGGRLNIDQFLMSDYRNVGFAYLMARPPVEFYGSLPTSLDGVDIARAWDLADARWRAKVYFGRAQGGDLATDSRIPVRPVLGATVSREADGLLLRAALTRGSIADAAPALRPLFNGLQALSALPLPEVAAQAGALRRQLDANGTDFTYAALGLSYERHDWQWTAELTRVSGHPWLRMVAGYAGVGRRFGAVTLFGAAAGVRNGESTTVAPRWAAALAPVLGPAAAQQAQALADGAAFAANLSAARQRALSLGLRWDLQPQLALKLQLDRVRISARGGRLWANATLDGGRAQVVSAVLDFVF
jgi:hypothetical protein